jgi:hypothetical protein
VGISLNPLAHNRGPFGPIPSNSSCLQMKNDPKTGRKFRFCLFICHFVVWRIIPVRSERVVRWEQWSDRSQDLTTGPFAGHRFQRKVFDIISACVSFVIITSCSKLRQRLVNFGSEQYAPKGGQSGHLLAKNYRRWKSYQEFWAKMRTPSRLLSFLFILICFTSGSNRFRNNVFAVPFFCIFAICT